MAEELTHRKHWGAVRAPLRTTLYLLAITGAASTKPPHLISIFADDLGWYDTALYNEHAPTPAIAALANDGLLLERHYVFRYCSPSRRSFLSGRFPTSITSVQPDGDRLCSDFLPLATTTLAEKLRDGAGYECHFFGKGHLGYETTDHLPINRGFASHVGFLSGSEHYSHGLLHGDNSSDLWLDREPALALAPVLDSATTYYAGRAVDAVEAHAADGPPLFMYVAFQNVHTPYEMPPEDERGAWPDFPLCADCVYAQMLHALDLGVDRVAKALKTTNKWDDALLLFTADNVSVPRVRPRSPSVVASSARAARRSRRRFAHARRAAWASSGTTGRSGATSTTPGRAARARRRSSRAAGSRRASGARGPAPSSSTSRTGTRRAGPRRSMF